MKEELIKKLVQIINWKVPTLATARINIDSMERYTDKLKELIDEFTETMMGKYGRPGLLEPEFCTYVSRHQCFHYWWTLWMVLQNSFANFTAVLDPKYDTDLLNLRDEMLGTINKSKYLLTLKILIWKGYKTHRKWFDQTRSKTYWTKQNLNFS